MSIKFLTFAVCLTSLFHCPGGNLSPSRKASERRRRLQPTMKFQLSIYYILIRKNNNIFRFPSSKRGRNDATAKRCWNKSLGALSEALPVISGSILGPMLFLLYANLLPDVVQSSRVAAFADDTNFSKTIVTQVREFISAAGWPKESRLLIVLWWPSLFGINIARIESQTENPFLYDTFRLPANANVARCYLEVANEYPDIHFKPSTDL